MGVDYFISDKKRRYLVYGFIILCFFLTFYLSVFKYQNFLVDFDLGMIERTVFNTLNGNFFFEDSLGTSHLFEHLHLILIFFLPLYYLFSHSITLFFAQSMAFALSAFFIYKLCNHFNMPRFFSEIFVLIYIFSPFNFFVNLEEFHPISFAVPLIIMMFYFIEKDNASGYFLSFIGLLLVKENMIILGLFMSVYLLFKKHRFARNSFLLSFYSFLATIIFIPEVYLRFFNWRYGWSFSSGLSLTAFISSLSFNANYFLGIFLPFLFVFIMSPISLIGIPIFFQNFLSIDVFQTCFLGHHSISLITILFIATIFVFKKLACLKKKWFYLLFAIFIIAQLTFSFNSYGLMFIEDSNNHYNNTIFESCTTNQRSGTNEIIADNKLINKRNIKLFREIPSNNGILTNHYISPYFSKYKYIEIIEHRRFTQHPEVFDYIILHKDNFEDTFEMLNHFYPELNESIFQTKSNIIIYKLSD